MKLTKNEDLNIRAFDEMLSARYLKNSYKLYWFTGIFEEIRNNKNVISFEDGVINMIASSWYSIVEYNLNFGKQDKLDNVINYIHSNYDIRKNIFYKNLKEDIKKIIKKDTDLKYSKLSLFYRYVPFRLITPFYPEIAGIKDYKKNKAIKELSQEDNRAIYKIKNQKIYINENWFEYIYNNQIQIEDWLQHKIISFLQDKNSDIKGISFKLKPSQKTDLKSVKAFWDTVINEKNIIDVYSKEIISNKQYNLDYFLPWDFILHSKAWNLYPTSNSLNCTGFIAESDFSNYLFDHCRNQFIALNYILENKYYEENGIINNLLEDYRDININIKQPPNRTVFIDKLSNKLKTLYKIAKDQGFVNN